MITKNDLTLYYIALFWTTTTVVNAGYLSVELISYNNETRKEPHEWADDEIVKKGVSNEEEIEVECLVTDFYHDKFTPSDFQKYAEDHYKAMLTLETFPKERPTNEKQYTSMVSFKCSNESKLKIPFGVRCTEFTYFMQENMNQNSTGCEVYKLSPNDPTYNFYGQEMKLLKLKEVFYGFIQDQNARETGMQINPTDIELADKAEETLPETTLTNGKDKIELICVLDDIEDDSKLNIPPKSMKNFKSDLHEKLHKKIALQDRMNLIYKVKCTNEQIKGKQLTFIERGTILQNSKGESVFFKFTQSFVDGKRTRITDLDKINFKYQHRLQDKDMDIISLTDQNYRIIEAEPLLKEASSSVVEITCKQGNYYGQKQSDFEITKKWFLKMKPTNMTFKFSRYDCNDDKLKQKLAIFKGEAEAPLKFPEPKISVPVAYVFKVLDDGTTERVKGKDLSSIRFKYEDDESKSALIFPLKDSGVKKTQTKTDNDGEEVEEQEPPPPAVKTESGATKSTSKKGEDDKFNEKDSNANRAPKRKSDELESNSDTATAKPRRRGSTDDDVQYNSEDDDDIFDDDDDNYDYEEEETHGHRPSAIPDYDNDDNIGRSPPIPKLTTQNDFSKYFTYMVLLIGMIMCFLLGAYTGTTM